MDTSAGDGAAASSSDAATTTAAAATAPAAGARDDSTRTLPTEIEVELEPTISEPARLVTVKIDSSHSTCKPYLGGYRHMKTGAVYHHASLQASLRSPMKKAVERRTRQTQTVRCADCTMQTSRESATQMQRPDLPILSDENKVVIPRQYQTSDELDRLREQSALLIQRHVRGFLAKLIRAELKEAHDERIRIQFEEEQEYQVQRQLINEYEIQRRLQPMTPNDFKLLHSELEEWKKHETSLVREIDVSEEEKKEALIKLLHRETRLLQTIEKLRVQANKKNRRAAVDQKMLEMGQPKTWELKNGVRIEVTTPGTERARELMQLLEGLANSQSSFDERLEALFMVKNTVGELPTQSDLTREILRLINREVDLLNRLRPVKSLQGLRRRILHLFVELLDDPNFNPESARYQHCYSGQDFELVKKRDKAAMTIVS